jgi:hypothetical protein
VLEVAYGGAGAAKEEIFGALNNARWDFVLFGGGGWVRQASSDAG